MYRAARLAAHHQRPVLCRLHIGVGGGYHRRAVGIRACGRVGIGRVWRGRHLQPLELNVKRGYVMKQVSAFEFVMFTASVAVIIAVATVIIGMLLEPAIGTWEAAFVGFVVGGMTAFYSGYSYARLRLFND